MQIELALIIGLLFASGVYMIVRRNIVKIIIGLSLISHGANLLIFTMGGLRRTLPPVITGDGDHSLDTMADPLPQALILTAIVIGFGVTAFALVLFQRAYRTMGTADIDDMKNTDLL